MRRRHLLTKRIGIAWILDAPCGNRGDRIRTQSASERGYDSAETKGERRTRGENKSFPCFTRDLKAFACNSTKEKAPAGGGDAPTFFSLLSHLFLEVWREELKSTLTRSLHSIHLLKSLSPGSANAMQRRLSVGKWFGGDPPEPLSLSAFSTHNKHLITTTVRMDRTLQDSRLQVPSSSHYSQAPIDASSRECCP